MSQTSVDPPANDAGGLHNSVLTRTHEPARSGNHSWIMLGGLAVAIIAGVAFWAYAGSHPAGPMVNHAVSASVPTYTTAKSAG